MPFLAEAMHQNLVRTVRPATGRPEAALSVHMEPWPEPEPARINEALLRDVAVVQKVVSLGRAARAAANLRVRQPLPAVLVRVPEEDSAEALHTHREQVLEELNVKAMRFLSRDDELVSYRVKPNLPRIGKRYGKLVPAIRQALDQAEGAAIATAVAQGREFPLVVEGQALRFGPEDVLIETASAEGYVSSREEGYLVALDTRVTEELRNEGLMRELTRTIQEGRKQAKYNVADREVVRYLVEATPRVTALLKDEQTNRYIDEETLTVSSVSTAFGLAPHGTDVEVSGDVEGEHWTFALVRKQ
jgi:isoleucyl-tRNA synthetase